MKHLLEVCLVALTLTAPITSSTQSVGASRPTPPMQKGISVELPVTNNAVPVPEADKPDSPIVTVTYDGSVYFGVSPISPAELTEKLKAAYSNRTEKTLYIKADARAPYASVVKVVDSLGTAGVEGLTLLTAQRNVEEPGTLVPPKGMELRVVSPHRAPQNTPGNK